VTADPFAPARRALVTGPVMMVVGAGLIYLGIAGDGLAWLLCVLGGLIALLGFLRLLAGAGSLAGERRRQRLLKEGLQGTAVVKTAEQVATKLGHPIYKMTLVVSAPNLPDSTVTKVGAIEPQFAGSVEAGAELPVRVDPGDTGTFAIDWGGF
jgi:hypothetical protein